MFLLNIPSVEVDARVDVGTSAVVVCSFSVEVDPPTENKKINC